MRRTSLFLAAAVSLAACQHRTTPGDQPVASSGPPAAPANGSSGCSKKPGPTGERRMAVNARTGLYIVSTPDGYDGRKALPLVFAFHGRNRNHQDCQSGDCAGIQSAMQDEAILVYLQSLREPLDAKESGWEHADELDGNLRFFEQVLSEVKTSYCVDERRVVVAGTSSGGSFANVLACRYGDQLMAVAPVSGGAPQTEGCKGAPAALVIHGIDDPHVPLGLGLAARESYVARSRCSPLTKPDLAGMHAAVRSKREAKPSVEVSQCVEYQGCQPGSAVRWCEHSYGGYDGSTHGWPPVGGQLIWDFVKTL